MHNPEHTTATTVTSAGLVTNKKAEEIVGAGGVYTVECVGSDGKTKWTDTFHNLVMTSGVQYMNTQFFTGSAYTQSLFVGLVAGPGAGTVFAANDTLVSHAGWSENATYAGARKAAIFGTATTANPSVITTASAPASFSMNATATIAGAFLATVSSGTGGVLFSGGDFSGGDKFVDSGDTLNVTYSFSLTAT